MLTNNNQEVKAARGASFVTTDEPSLIGWTGVYDTCSSPPSYYSDSCAPYPRHHISGDSENLSDFERSLRDIYFDMADIRDALTLKIHELETETTRLRDTFERRIEFLEIKNREAMSQIFDLMDEIHDLRSKLEDKTVVLSLSEEDSDFEDILRDIEVDMSDD